MEYISIKDAIKKLEEMAENNKLGEETHILLNLKSIDDINEILESDTGFSLTKRSVDSVMKIMPEFKRIKKAEDALESMIVKAAKKFWKERKKDGCKK